MAPRYKGQSLNANELKALQLAADGDSVRDTMKKMSYSKQSVFNFRSYARIKLGAKTLPHAVAKALRKGLIK